MTSISFLNDGWLELESDPGLFTLLIEDFGCKGVQVEEIYDLSKKDLIEGHVYGFIFLFKWIEERRSRHRQMFNNVSSNSKTLDNNHEPYYVEDENLVNSMFFAHQIIPNSCATHAILSVLLNCKEIDLGENLKRLKEMTYLMDPESKGLAISNIPELAKAHNLHASETDIQEKKFKQSSTKCNSFPRTSSIDSFHFISFICVNNRVYELDGLKKYPIDHGLINNNETFSEKFRKIILERIPQQQQKDSKSNSQLRKLQTEMNTLKNDDIRFSLMAVVPDKYKEYSKRLKILKSKRLMLLEILEYLIKPTKLPDPYEFHNYSKYPIRIKDNSNLDVNINKFVIKDINYNSKNSKNLNLTKESNDLSSNSNQNSSVDSKKNKNNHFKENDFKKNSLKDDYSTDSCSETESEIKNFSDSDDEKIENLFAFKFVSLKEKSTAENLNEKEDLLNKDLYKSFTKNELIEFYRDYGLKDLLKILNKIEQEITLCNKNILDEKEKRNKFHIDDSRRTHNYNEFISTYLLMMTEQKKLNEFLENSKKTKQSKVQFTDDPEKDNIPIKFLKELLKKYEYVFKDDEDTLKTDGTKNSLIDNVSIKENDSKTNSLNKRKYTKRLPKVEKRREKYK